MDGNAVDVIVGLSGKFDLVIMGVDKRGGLRILRGGTTERVVTMAACPVSVVREK